MDPLIITPTIPSLPSTIKDQVYAWKHVIEHNAVGTFLVSKWILLDMELLEIGDIFQHPRDPDLALRVTANPTKNCDGIVEVKAIRYDPLPGEMAYCQRIA